MLYGNLCCDRGGWWKSMTTGKSGGLWGYNPSLESLKLKWEEIKPWMKSLAPGYDEMWWGASMWDGYPRLIGSYGTLNGIYHNHGLQNPIIPYEDRLFVHRSNAVIALGPNPASIRRVTQDETPEEYEQNIRHEMPDVYLPLLRIEQPDQVHELTLSVDDVRALLNTEIAKLLEIGHLRPGYFNSTRNFQEFANYFENPGDTLLILLRAYPYVSDNLKPALKSYIEQHYGRYFSDQMIARTGYWIDDPVPYDLARADGFGQLQPREWMPTAPEVAAHIRILPAEGNATSDWPWRYPQQNFYAMWLYAKQFHGSDQDVLREIYEQAKSRVEMVVPESDTLVDKPWVHNGFIAGYIGFLNLQKLANMDSQDAMLRATVQANLTALLAQRASNFRKDSPWAGLDPCCGNYREKSRFNVARNFLYMTPELADYLRRNAYDTITDSVQEYGVVAPYRISSRYEASYGEFSTDSLYTNNALFFAKAYLLKESTDQLLKYLDVPAFAVGDLFYILNMVAIFDSHSDAR